MTTIVPNTDAVRDEDSHSRAVLAVRAARSVGDAIARAHAASLREAGPDTTQGLWIRQRLDRELRAARVALRRVLEGETSRGGVEQLAEAYELCRIWRDVDAEFAECEGLVVHELAVRFGVEQRWVDPHYD